MSPRLRLLSATAVAAVASSLVLATPALATPAVQRPTAPAPHTVSVGSNPADIAISQSLGKAFVVNDGSISVVSLLTRRQLAEFGTGNGHGQNGIALMRGNTQAYVTDLDSNKVTVVDTEANTVIKKITVGSGATAVVKANTSHGQVGYVGYGNTPRLTGINTSTGKIVQQVRLPAGTQTLTTVPGGREVWAGSVASGKIFVIDTGKGRVTKAIDVTRTGPVTAIAFAPGHKRAWVAGLGGVSVVDVASGRTVKFLPILSLFSSRVPNMGELVLSGSGRYAYVENSTFPDSPGKGQITAIDTTSYRVAWRLSTGIEPVSLSIDASRGVAYTANYADDTLTYLRVSK